MKYVCKTQIPMQQPSLCKANKKPLKTIRWDCKTNSKTKTQKLTKSWHQTKRQKTSIHRSELLRSLSLLYVGPAPAIELC